MGKGSLRAHRRGNDKNYVRDNVTEKTWESKVREKFSSNDIAVVHVAEPKAGKPFHGKRATSVPPLVYNNNKNSSFRARAANLLWNLLTVSNRRDMRNSFVLWSNQIIYIPIDVIDMVLDGFIKFYNISKLGFAEEPTLYVEKLIDYVKDNFETFGLSRWVDKPEFSERSIQVDKSEPEVIYLEGGKRKKDKLKNFVGKYAGIVPGVTATHIKSEMMRNTYHIDQESKIYGGGKDLWYAPHRTWDWVGGELDDWVITDEEDPDGTWTDVPDVGVSGGGGGKSFISNNVKNKGSGGGRKKNNKGWQQANQANRPLRVFNKEQPQECPPACDFTPSSGPCSPDGEPESRYGPGCGKREYPDFVYGDDPLGETLFRPEELAPLLDGLPLGRIRHFVYDQFGAPFCGLVAIDVATGFKPDLDNYVMRANGRNPVLALGGNMYLEKYAASRQVNLVICSYINDYNLSTMTNAFNPLWKTVILKHIRMICDDDGEECDHYCLVVKKHATDEETDLVIPKPHRFTCFKINSDIKLGQRRLDFSNRDRRSFRDRRDKLKYQDSYREVTIRKSLDIFLFGYGFSFDLDCLDRVMVISESRFREAYIEGQNLAGSGNDPLKSLILVDRMSEINTNPDLPLIFLNTKRALEVALSNLDRSNVEINNRGLIAYNAPNNNVAMPNLNNAARMRLQGGGNEVRKYILNDPKINMPIAVAPIGCPVLSKKRVVGPGAYSVTDSPGLLAAFVGRSMTKVPGEGGPINDFVDFSKNFLDEMIDKLEGHITEPDPVEFFREHYKGIKSQKEIEQTLKVYEECSRGYRRKKGNSAFVKFEDNCKETESGLLGRPRLIMTMSNEMLVELCPIIALLDKWNHGPVRDFQVKDMSPQEMIDKICHHSKGNHCVTDYSSFESSITPLIRKIEIHLMERLCLRFGFKRTLAALNRYGRGFRTLESKWGSFLIGSRCSGDFWTSVGNGIISICLMKYCSKDKESDFKMIAEGDDGLVPIEVPDVDLLETLGFKFSSEIAGTKEGDADFLRSRWIDGKRYLNIGRCLKVFWVRKACRLKRSKQLFLLRCAGLSLYYLSPGHPVLTAIVNRIGRETRSMTKFRSASLFLDTWKGEHKLIDGSYPIDVKVDESMRVEVAKGATGFEPLSINQQLHLEKVFDEDQVFNLGNVFDNCEEVRNFCKTSFLEEIEHSPDSEDFENMVTMLKRWGVLKDKRRAKTRFGMGKVLPWDD
jgi:hypothetical protein